MATAQSGLSYQVKIGDLEKETKSKKGEKPKFTTDFPRAVILEGADELNLRAREEEEVRFFHIDSTNVGNKRWADLAFCQAIYNGVEGTRVRRLVFSIQGNAPSGQV